MDTFSIIALINKIATICHDSRNRANKVNMPTDSNSDSRKIRLRVDVLIEDLLIL
jgi:hypothetical protein